MRGGSADLTVAGGDPVGVGEALTGDMPLVGVAGDGGVGIAGDRGASLLIGINGASKTCATAKRTLAVAATADRHSKGMTLARKSPAEYRSKQTSLPPHREAAGLPKKLARGGAMGGRSEALPFHDRK